MSQVCNGCSNSASLLCSNPRIFNAVEAPSLLPVLSIMLNFALMCWALSYQRRRFAAGYCRMHILVSRI